MTYGLRTWGPNGLPYIDPVYLGAVCLGRYQVSSGQTQTIAFPSVPYGELRVMYPGRMGHDTAILNTSGYSSLQFTPRYTGVLNNKLPIDSTVFVFARTTFEPDYGFMVISDSGERLVSTIHPVPEFIGKFTFGPAPGTVTSIGDGNLDHGYTVSSAIGAGRSRLVLYSLPSLNGNFWFTGTSHVSAAVTGNFNLTLRLIASSTIPVPLPQAYVFAVDNLVASSDGYGLRVWDGAGKVLFDSGKYHMVCRDSMAGIQFPVNNGPTQYDFYSGMMEALSTPLVLLPPYSFESYTPIQGQQRSNYKRSEGFIRRVGGTLSTKTFETNTRVEDSATNASYQFGNYNNNATFVVDGSLY